MQRQLDRSMKFCTQSSHGPMNFGIDKYGVLEKVAKQHRSNGHETNHHRWNCQQHQRQGNHPGRLMRLARGMMVVMAMPMVGIRVLIKTFLSMKHQKIHAEGVERCDEDTCHHCKICKSSGRQTAGMYRHDDFVFGVEAGKNGVPISASEPNSEVIHVNRHVFAQTTHPANVLIVVHTHDDRTCCQGTAMP
jgi:hypothetical protein